MQLGVAFTSGNVMGKDLFLFFRLLLAQVMVFFALQELFSLMRSRLLTVPLSARAVVLQFRKSSPVPVSSRLPLPPNVLFYQVQSIWVYVDGFDPFGVDLCAG